MILKNNKGMTAIEILLVLLIMLLLAGGVLVNFRVLDKFDGLASSRKIIDVMDNASITAMSSDRHIAVVIFEEGKNYYIGQTSSKEQQDILKKPNKADATKLGSMKSGGIFVAGEPLAKGEAVVFAFDKASGAFAEPRLAAKAGFELATFADGTCKLEISSKPARTVVLTKRTGRSYLEEEND